MEKTPLHRLSELARLYNVQTEYYDIFGNLRRPSPEGIIQVLRSLGAPMQGMGEVPGALRERRQALWLRGIEPVMVVWEGAPLEFKLRISQDVSERPVHFDLQLECGERISGEMDRDPRVRIRAVEGVRYSVVRLTIPKPLPPGYHQLRLHIQDKSFESLVISAPLWAYQPCNEGHKAWGVFLPLYALRSRAKWGAGDFSDLERLADWVKRLGGAVLGTLPLLPAFLDCPFDPSPYSPVSRLFWNEFYVDLTRIPELARCPPALELTGSGAFQSETEALRAAPLVDYRRQMVLRRRVLEQLTQCLLREKSQRYRAFRRFVQSHGAFEDYAEFRAATERQGKPWTDWSQPSRDGTIKANEYDADVKRYYLFAQWAAHEQMEALRDKGQPGGSGLYLDFPLGVHRQGYDVWRERAAFALDASGGAPPDDFFTKGQNWGFPPLHPEQLPKRGYRYYIASLRNHMRHCRFLRIDHVMGLHRLFWIPQGLEPVDGVYVRYPAEKFYAIMNLESHRNRAGVIGENLGTVPAAVNAGLERHKIYGMYVGQFSVRPNPEIALDEPPGKSVASLNTHDTPTFAGFWEEQDIESRLELGLLSDADAALERQRRSSLREALIGFLRRQGRLKEEAPSAGDVLKAWLAHLATGPAQLILINLEDLWLESKPQNMPGTGLERPNWQRKARYSFEEFSQMADVMGALRTIDRLRKGK